MSRTFAIDYFPVDAADLELGSLTRYLDWWRSFTQTHPYPTRNDLNFRDFRGWHSHMTLCAAVDGNSDLELRIIGEEVKSLFAGGGGSGRVQLERGTRLGEVIEVSPERQRAHVQKIVDTPAIALTQGLLKLGSGRAVDVFCLDFPLAPLPDETAFVLSIYDFSIPSSERYLPHQGLSDV